MDSVGGSGVGRGTQQRKYVHRNIGRNGRLLFKYFLSGYYAVCHFHKGKHHLVGDGLKEHFLKKYHLPLQSLKPGSNKEKTWKKVSNELI